MKNISNEDLLAHAWKAKENSQSAYSQFAVGAALLSADGQIITGCNIESSSYGLSCCAERVALFKALSDGITKFVKIAVVTSAPLVCPPCGACLQLLTDYAPGISVVLANESDQSERQLNEFIPFAFNQQFLEK
jgi:cytidine deaminase